MTEDREALAKSIAGARGLTLIPPFDHADVIAGQGTAAKELIEDTGPLDYLFVCVGGGGLISGCALAAHALAGTAGGAPLVRRRQRLSKRSPTTMCVMTPHARLNAQRARVALLGGARALKLHLDVLPADSAGLLQPLVGVARGPGSSHAAPRHPQAGPSAATPGRGPCPR